MTRFFSGLWLNNWLKCGLLVLIPALVQASGDSSAEQMVEKMVTRVTGMLENKAMMLADNVPDSSWEVRVSPPGNLNRLKPCEFGFQLEDSRPGEVGRQRVKVRCEGPRKWSIYLGGDIDLYANVLVAKVPLVSGQEVPAGNVSLQRRNLGELRRGYLSDISFLSNMTLRRRVRAGDALAPSMFERSWAVRRGDSVQIQAGRNGLLVSMPGEILENAALGDNVRVRNLSSGKEVVARVQGHGIVVVGL